MRADRPVGAAAGLAAKAPYRVAGAWLRDLRQTCALRGRAVSGRSRTVTVQATTAASRAERVHFMYTLSADQRQAVAQLRASFVAAREAQEARRDG